MQKTINNISTVIVAEQHYDVEKEQPGITWVIELTEEGICTYHKEYKSQKKLGVSETPVNKDVMTAFFKELYEFARSADMSCEIIGDCSRKVTFIYSSLHKEIFEGATCKGEETLVGKIEGFVKLFR